MTAGAPGKVRRVDFYPDEFLAGVDTLSVEESGLYWQICSKIYSRGAGLPDDDAENARIFRLHPRTLKRLKSVLLANHKIEIVEGTIVNRRCLAELKKTQKRIDDARAAGAQGGRPPNGIEVANADDTPNHSRMTDESLARSLVNDSRFIGDNPPPVSNENSNVTKAAGFSGEKLTNNHQPTTTNLPKEDIPPKDTDSHAFTGRLIRLTAADLKQWQSDYHAIPDLQAELITYDAWLDDNTQGQERKKWYPRTRKRMNQIHQERLVKLKRDRGNGADLNEAW